jgi:hypothetical protein
MMKFRLHAVTALGIAAAVLTPTSAAQAQINVTNTAGFSGAVPQTSAALPYISYCGGTAQPICSSNEPDQVRWGQPASGSGQSRLGYTPAAAGNVGSSEFVLGTLLHHNVPTVSGTSLTAVDLSIETTVTDTDRSVTFDEDVTFLLNIDETTNDSSNCPGTPNPCPDFIQLPPGGVSFAPVTEGNAVYQLEVLGFRAAGGAVQTTMVSQEGGNSSVQLIGKVTRNVLPTVDAGGDYTGTEGASVALDGNASDDDADPLTLGWSYAAAPGTDAGTSCSFSDDTSEDPAFTCTDDGTFEVTLEADDGKGGVTTETSMVTLGNAAPVIASVGTSAAAPVPVGTSVSVSAPYTDAGSNDTHTWSVSWGDGSPDDNGSGAVSGSHVYPTPGVYSVTVTVTDDDTDSDTETSALVVVYDPSAGFVTGGGWIDSPAGAYVADPSLTGRANFGFVSKYKKGATVPEGSTQFQFQAADLSFHSSSYEWLVVAGSKAQYKGTGTINGAGSYGFMLTARDGGGTSAPDAVRVRIWDQATGSVVYDNQSGDALTADAVDALEGGSVVIHAK